jgi:hypothetical protein
VNDLYFAGVKISLYNNKMFPWFTNELMKDAMSSENTLVLDCSDFYALLESTLKLIQNGLNNLFTAQVIAHFIFLCL